MAKAIRIEEFDDPGYDPYLSDEENFSDDLDPHSRIHALRERGTVISQLRTTTCDSTVGGIAMPAPRRRH